MNILISNDDGYNKPGIIALKKVLSKYGTVYMSAPLKEQSGKSISLTLKDDINYAMLDEYSIVVDGTPGDTAGIGLGYFNDIKFDLFVSGINKGLNEGKDSLFSGTVGAGVIGALSNIKTICLSGDFEETDYERRSEYILDYIFKNNLLDIAPFLNVNFPRSSYPYTGKGIKVGRIYNVPKEESHLEDFGGKVFKTKKRGPLFDSPIDSDVYYSNHGYYSITPFRPSLEDSEKIELLKGIIENNN